MCPEVTRRGTLPETVFKGRSSGNVGQPDHILANHSYPLALIANRDEFHLRQSAAAGCDPEAAAVYGGRDLVPHGRWLQVSTRGRLATVTNVRAGPPPEEAPRSRGWLVLDFARGDGEAVEYAAALESTAGESGRFNLLLWDGAELVFASNHPQTTYSAVSPGLHAMSNGAFDAPWPKSGHATRALDAWLESAQYGERYGTRCSSVVLIGHHHFVFAERRFGPKGVPAGESLVTLPFSAIYPAGNPQRRDGEPSNEEITAGSGIRPVHNRRCASAVQSAIQGGSGRLLR